MLDEKSVDRRDSVIAESDFTGDTRTLPSHEDIAALAHALWEARGGGDGGADEDWLEAERQLRAPKIKAQSA